jgi:hypothetical protein
MAYGQIITVGSTHRFRPLSGFKKDGVVWDITGATVTIIFTKPDGTQVTKSATLVTPGSGIAEYVTLTADFDVAGTWYYKWRVVQGSVDLATEPIPFAVV